jgi:hypothetical protein
MRQDGRRPDGLQLIPWQGRRPMTWDVSTWLLWVYGHTHVDTMGSGGVGCHQEIHEVYRTVQKLHFPTDHGWELMGQ